MIFTITAPGRFLRTNQRDHFHQRAILVRTWRQAAQMEGLRLRPPAFKNPVHITATIHRADRRIYDLDGIAPTVKACIDGLRDAGVLRGDDTRYIPQLTLKAGELWADASVVITITELETS